jgi:Arc/MetJ-type ribon-helix-helix transcriptional regulator
MDNTIREVRQTRAVVSGHCPGFLTPCGGMTIIHTEGGDTMPMAKIAVSIDGDTLAKMDRAVKSGRFANRSKLVQAAVHGVLTDVKKKRLAAECAKLDPEYERRLADEASDTDSWPEY